jgi:hypothetical protein
MANHKHAARAITEATIINESTSRLLEVSFLVFDFMVKGLPKFTANKKHWQIKLTGDVTFLSTSGMLSTRD